MEYKGVWLNSNMQEHEMFQAGFQKATEVISITSEDGANQRKIGLLAVLSDAPGLYKKNAFNGAKIEDPYETIAKYKDILEKEEKVDLVIPLCHLYVPQDMVTCERFDFPIVLSGHDHHLVDTVFSGTRLLKPGADADFAIIIDIVWDSAESCQPEISAKTVKVSDYPADPELEERVRLAYSILSRLRKTQLTPIPQKFQPLSSIGNRSHPTTMASFLWTCLREALNSSSKDVEGNTVDCVVISGGHLRGSKLYPENSFFSMEDMKSEIQEKDVTTIVKMTGAMLERGIKSTRACPNPGFLQHDDGITWSDSGELLTVGGEKFDANKIYRVAAARWDIYEGPCTEWVEHFRGHHERGLFAVWPIYSSIVSYFAKNIWLQIFNELDANKDGVIDAAELSRYDLNKDGCLDRAEMIVALKSMGFEVDEEELSFVDCVMEMAGDRNRDGILTLEELNN
eukprot:TRINITY_DN2610_c0_g1_i1.p1 TRINITY_DN2610_c0_g1~~TRINITY_DN2610_c0_g1_i1.p1  ORF type:complete len:455 (+),score=64.78 TRINITY_DN2610_c0_g1_i1:720-2084(+)